MKTDPVFDQVAAISCGVVDDQTRLDLEYEEDSRAQADGNFVLSASGGIIEAQVTAEDRAISDEDFQELMRLARTGCTDLFALQKAALG